MQLPVCLRRPEIRKEKRFYIWQQSRFAFYDVIVAYFGGINLAVIARSASSLNLKVKQGLGSARTLKVLSILFLNCK
jgi:hypothetical protein